MTDLIGEVNSGLEIIKNQFDYNSLDAETREKVRVKTAEIGFYLSNTIQSAVEAGKRFIEVRELLKHNKNGGFEGWLRLEFGMTRIMAYRFINLAESPNCNIMLQLNISQTVAYLLSAPSTPESAVNEALEKAEAGEKLTVKDTKELIDAHRKIEEQNKKIEQHSEHVRVLLDEIDGLRAQMPGDKVKKRIADLEAQVKDLKENPVKVEVEKKVVVPPNDYEDLKKFRTEADEVIAKSKAELGKNEKELERLRTENRKTDEYVKRIADLSRQVGKQKEKIADMEQEKQLSFISDYIYDAYKLVGKAMANIEEQKENAMQIFLPDYLLKSIDGMINDLEEIKRRNRIIDSEVIVHEKVDTNTTVPVVQTFIDNNNYLILENKGLFTIRYKSKKYKAKFNEEVTDRIEWARYSWNPVTGCRMGCPYCYARDKAENPFYAKGFPVQFRPAFYPDRLDAPKNTKCKTDYPNNVFVCSMADLFGEWIPTEWIKQILQAVKENRQWNYLFLTKNPERYSEFQFPENCWLGATAHTQEKADKAIEVFNKMDNQHIHFLSCEPLSEAVNIAKADNLQWVIVGGQSKIKGLFAHQPAWEWVKSLVSTAQDKRIPLYFKPNLEIKEDMAILKEMPLMN